MQRHICSLSTQVPAARAHCSVLRSQFLAGRRVQAVQQSVTAKRVASCSARAAAQEGERYRLDNLSPQPGSKHRKKRKGRGHAAGQGGSAGRGMRGQKSRAGATIRPGFEGGQIPLYRRLPKLKGIAGGMSAGLTKYATVNLSDLSAFSDSEEVTLEALVEKRVLSISGREKRLPLKVLGEGDLPGKLQIKAASFSQSALQKIEEAGGKAEVVPRRPKFTRALARRRIRERAAQAEKGKKPADLRTPRKLKKKAAAGLP
ncbi:hypothetical protein WJX73_009056 [Symbiochloris irregularis]|uniref:Large ribosomal subunit protein uL15/eL18 domain-containing protein n=1 Tax=Symbiochloris irregularis TaxID=706552 RepID=A0AAW1NNR9_9CHLO